MFDFLFRNRRRRKLLQAPMSPSWRQSIRHNVAVVDFLSASQQRRLEEAARIIAAERPIVGCGGQAINDEVVATIAAQAALLLLGEDGYYFERVPSILVYPQAYARRHSLGSLHPVEEDAALLGESWQRGSIVLSWPAVLAGGRDPRDGQNLVLHEFAHHLDSLDGEMGGLPPLPTAEAEARWIAVFGREFERHSAEVAVGAPTLLDPYGATNKAEMFAVATECFFEQPLSMRERHGQLFACFREFFKVDPSQWFEEEKRAPSHPQSRRARPGEDEEPDDDAASSEQPKLATADRYFTRGYEYFHLGRFELAESDFNQAVRLDPQDQEALRYRGEARFALGHVAAALADAERACQLDADDLDARRLRGMARVAGEQFSTGVNDLDAALDSQSEDSEALFFRGLAHARLAHLQEAIRDSTRVIELDPDDAEAYHERATCWERLGDQNAARGDRQKSLSLGLPSEMRLWSDD